METTHSTATPESPSQGGPGKHRRWVAVGAATLALMSAGFGIGVAQAQTSGGDGTTTTVAPDATPDTTTPDAAAPDEGDRPTDAEVQAFRDCMAENGVDLPAERPAPGDRPDRTAEEQATFDAALTACADLKPEGFGHHGGPGCDGHPAPGADDPNADASGGAAS